MEDFIVWQRAVLCRHCLWDVDKVQFRCRSCSNSLGLGHIFKPNYIVLHNRSVKLCLNIRALSLGCASVAGALILWWLWCLCRQPLRQRSSTCCIRDACLCRIFFAFIWTSQSDILHQSWLLFGQKSESYWSESRIVKKDAGPSHLVHSWQFMITLHVVACAVVITGIITSDVYLSYTWTFLIVRILLPREFQENEGVEVASAVPDLHVALWMQQIWGCQRCQIHIQRDLNMFEFGIAHHCAALCLIASMGCS